METKLTAALYVRVSTADQNYDLQLHDLRSYAKRQGWATVEYAEKESSVKKRSVFERMLKDARDGKVDLILVWRIDRFARSMKDYVMTTLDLYQWKVRLISTTENVDTGDQNPFAEFTRGLLALTRSARTPHHRRSCQRRYCRGAAPGKALRPSQN